MDTSKRRYPLPPGVRWGDPKFAPAQDAILALLKDSSFGLGPGVSASAISRYLGMSRQAAQQTLKRLEARGLVRKERFPGLWHPVRWFVCDK